MNAVSDALVLSYHAVANAWPSSLAIRTDQLEYHVSTLLARGYAAATLTEALSGDAARSFAVTFDDGFRSVLDRGLPVLDRLGVPATIFLPTALIGPQGFATWPGPDAWRGTEYEDELRLLDWDEVGTLIEHGWEIGSHTRWHKRLPELGDAELAAELGESKGQCEMRLGRPCDSIAYPYGDYDARVVAAAREAGYRFGCTLPSRFPAPAPLAWPRVGLYLGDGKRAFRLKTSQTGLRVRRTPAWDAASRLRGLIAGGETSQPPGPGS
jgi:peptidoglycan/xylan/chitin deacetylase (PgdA/CDA1 family)